ncbi:hypothetical protein JHW44_10955 [Paracoccus seriniphilus]|nr:hypothetical protein JHW44_10955 [Paracoccus seriniphilus]
MRQKFRSAAPLVSARLAGDVPRGKPASGRDFATEATSDSGPVSFG